MIAFLQTYEQLNEKSKFSKFMIELSGRLGGKITFKDFIIIPPRDLVKVHEAFQSFMYALKSGHQYYERIKTFTLTFKNLSLNAKNFIDPVILNDKLIDIITSCTNLNKRCQQSLEQIKDSGKFYMEGPLDLYSTTDETITPGSYYVYIFSTLIIIFTMDDKKKKKEFILYRLL